MQQDNITLKQDKQKVKEKKRNTEGHARQRNKEKYEDERINDEKVDYVPKDQIRQYLMMVWTLVKLQAFSF